MADKLTLLICKLALGCARGHSCWITLEVDVGKTDAMRVISILGWISSTSGTVSSGAALFG